MLKVIHKGVDISHNVKAVSYPTMSHLTDPLSTSVTLELVDGSLHTLSLSEVLLIETSTEEVHPCEPSTPSDGQVLAPSAVKYYTGDKPLEAGMWFRTKDTFGNMMAEFVTEREVLVLDKDGLVEAYSLEDIKPAHTPEEVERDNRLKEQCNTVARICAFNTALSHNMCTDIAEILQENNILREV